MTDIHMLGSSLPLIDTALTWTCGQRGVVECGCGSSMQIVPQKCSNGSECGFGTVHGTGGRHVLPTLSHVLFIQQVRLAVPISCASTMCHLASAISLPCLAVPVYGLPADWHGTGTWESLWSVPLFLAVCSTVAHSSGRCVLALSTMFS
jgi:hypothetical protein